MKAEDAIIIGGVAGFLELPQLIMKKGEYLSIAKYYFGYKGKCIVVTEATSRNGRRSNKDAGRTGE